MNLTIETPGAPRAEQRPGARSIRQVRLVGRPPGDWAEGQDVVWAGRGYRVAQASSRYARLEDRAGSAVEG